MFCFNISKIKKFTTLWNLWLQKRYDKFFSHLLLLLFFLDPGWVKISIQDKRPGSETLLQSCKFLCIETFANRHCNCSVKQILCSQDWLFQPVLLIEYWPIKKKLFRLSKWDAFGALSLLTSRMMRNFSSPEAAHLLLSVDNNFLTRNSCLLVIFLISWES